MSCGAFALDPRLGADTRLVASLPLCDVQLMDDARYAWLVLVPRRGGLVEIADLSDDEQGLLWREVNLAARALRAVAPCDKLNLGALGNIVR
ncbi:MAG TPA: HIT domain-containing protein, partial [Rhodanobacter sp.]|nr:HIT domain-containing protein [Rhodanobacter sp.]